MVVFTHHSPLTAKRSRATLAEARDRACLHQEEQVERVARASGQRTEEVVERLEALVDRVEIRITRGLMVIPYLLDELNAGRVRMIRSVFETGRQDYTQDPQVIAGVVTFRAEREPNVFGPEPPLSRKRTDRSTASPPSRGRRPSRIRSGRCASSSTSTAPSCGSGSPSPPRTAASPASVRRRSARWTTL